MRIRCRGGQADTQRGRGLSSYALAPPPSCSAAGRGRRSASMAIFAAPVHDQGVRTELDEVSLVKGAGDRVEVRLE